MPNPSINPKSFYFKEPRLELSIPGRFILRFLVDSFYVVLGALTLSAFISQVDWLFWLGILLVLFLGDRLMHAGAGYLALSELGKKSQRDVNSADYLSPGSLNVLEKAMEKSLISNLDFHLGLLKILNREKDIKEGLIRMEVSPEEFEQKIDDLLQEEKQPSKKEKTDLLFRIESLSKDAMILAYGAGEKYIEPRALFGALINVKNEKVSRLFSLFSIEPGDLENALIFGKFHKKWSWLTNSPSLLGEFAHHPKEIRHRIMNRAWTARPTPTLDKYSTDFTDLAREEKIGLLIGHAKEYERLVDVLCRRAKPNALLIGEPGAGKETLISHLAYEIVKDKVPEPLFDKRLVSLQIGNLVSGVEASELSSRINKILGEIIAAGNIVLYIPDIHNLVKTSGTNYMSAADILIPAIMNDEFPVIGATYPREFKQMIEIQSDFNSAFEHILVDEVSEEEAIKILTYSSLIFERQYKVIVCFNAIKQAVALAHKYFHQKLLPASAEELLKESLADVSQKGEKSVRAIDIIATAERKINIPIHQASQEEAQKLLNLEKIIHERLIDQEEAVSAVSRALREYRSGLARKGGPIAVFLFVGPTGVGKTELAKILTTIQFGSEQMMIRFDMSEYQDKQSIFRFIGSPDGKMPGNLTESVLQKPYSLILLDEFEKANPDILNLFLQVFDDGRLTDNLGRTIDFTNTIIIATSNAHSDFIKSHIEAQTPMKVISEELKKKLTDYFKPELLNRFSGIIVFKTLSLKDVQAVAKIQLLDLANNLSGRSGINLTYDDEVIQKIAELGFDPVFGGRPLRGVISEKIRSVLAEKILTNELIKGSNIQASLDQNSEVVFKTKS